MNHNNTLNYQKYIAKYIPLWLTISMLLVFVMILLGGITRLTGSGLSIVQWKPVSGIIPPLSATDWKEEFSAYQQSPEFKLINSNMNLEEFRSIFLIEYLHRLLGRITGMVIILPFILFNYFGVLNKLQYRRLLVVNLLVIIQGIVGWYMVKSGLNDTPYVSHYRLAIHLFLAMMIYHILVSELFLIKSRNIIEVPIGNISIGKISVITALNLAIIILLHVQIILGAFVSGLDAGMIYNSFPYMGNGFIPEELLNQRLDFTILDNAAIVQFIHRWTAIVIASIILYYKGLINKLYVNLLTMSGTLSFIIVIIQVTTGITTLVYQVPIWSALIHQVGAVLLLTSLLFTRSILLIK